MNQKKSGKPPLWLAGWIVLWCCVSPLPAATDQESVFPDINAVQLNADDLAFGRAQLERLLHDRPAMAGYVRKGDPVYRWVVRQLAGGAVRQHIYWSNHFEASYPKVFFCYHVVPNRSRPAAIAIRERYAAGPQKGRALSGSALWACFVFELFNLSHTQEGRDAWQAALDGTASRAAYIERCTRSEFAAGREAKRFYQIAWQPALAGKGSEDNRAIDSFLDFPEDYSQWIKRYTDPRSYPFNVFGQAYDAMEAQRARRRKSGEEAQQTERN